MDEVPLRQEWIHRAACADADPELFFPVGTTGPAERDQEEAKRVCTRCPVRDQCLAYALGSGQTSGVWGGKDEAELAALRRRRRAAQRWEARRSDRRAA
ncbi:WhiB family transcriptional regulator [Streptomyces sp. RK9]|uniref:WhiB family transcriptional regulator n=1 Tax=Streptomyces sp. RK9 TaxID=3239284 RepID=UPI0038683031